MFPLSTPNKKALKVPGSKHSGKEIIILFGFEDDT